MINVMGRRFAYWIKYTPGLPFKIVGTKNGSLLYQKIGINPNAIAQHTFERR